jgi:hypothetical protein
MIKQSNLVLIYLISIVLVIAGAYIKMTNGGGGALLIAGILGTVVFLVIALTEVFQSRRISGTEKLLWTAGFLLFNGITALLYLLIGRKKVVAAHE